MALPVVTIVGRPNVGKSSLLNMLARQRISIVDPRAGITRDRVSAIIEHADHYFELIDTGGIGIVDDDHLEEHVEGQIRFAIAQAALIVFVVDVRDGFTPLDNAVAAMLRRMGKPIILVANKVDDERLAPEAAVYEGIGFGPVVRVSAHHGYGREELLGRVLAHLGESASDAPTTAVMKLAIIGKRNAGKSTLVNALAGEERVIVSEIPGTTRDAVDVRVEFDGRPFIVIDTAGVRKRKSMSDIDYYSHNRAIQSIRRADIVLHLVDATVPVSEVDLKLAGSVQEELKPAIIGINKWDLVGDRAGSEDYGHYISQVMPAWPYVPLVFLTAQTGRNVRAAVELASSLFNQAQTRVSTAKLNAALEPVLAARGPSAKHGTKPVKIYYATQVATAPPTIVFFCNHPASVTENYRRYLENRLREVTPFREIPMRLLFRPRSGREPAEG